MKESHWPYLAGLVDGEGFIGILRRAHDNSKRKYHSNCGVSYALEFIVINCEVRLMRYLVEYFGGRFYTLLRHQNDNARVAYRWYPSGRKNQERTLLNVLPYLVIKREQAMLALEFIRLNGSPCPEKRQEMYEKSRLLNRRGVSPTTNTADPETVKIESELMGDHESDLSVTASS